MSKAAIGPERNRVSICEHVRLVATGRVAQSRSSAWSLIAVFVFAGSVGQLVTSALRFSVSTLAGGLVTDAIGSGGSLRTHKVENSCRDLFRPRTKCAFG